MYAYIYIKQADKIALNSLSLNFHVATESSGGENKRFIEDFPFIVAME